MKALFFDGRALRLEQRPLPAPTEGEALVKVRYAGICSTDLEILKGYMHLGGIPGHEFTGRVVECSEPALMDKRVVGEINCVCGNCDLCRRGQSNHCSRRSVLGIFERDGVFAEYLTLPEKNCHILDESIKDQDAVFVEPLAACFRVVEQLNFDETMKVFVLGDGRLGLLMIQVFAGVGPKPVLVGKHKDKMRIAESLGYRTINVKDIDKQSADVVIECTGRRAGLNVAMEMLKPEGKLVLKSTLREEHVLDLSSVVVNEITIIGSRCGPFERALSAIKSGQVHTASLISGIFALEEYEEAFARASSGECIKILFELS